MVYIPLEASYMFLDIYRQIKISNDWGTKTPLVSSKVFYFHF